MKKGLIVIVALVLSLSITLVSCGPKKEASSSDAIKIAKSMDTLEEKTNYLIGQAKAFYNSKDFQDSVEIAQYILRYLDRDSAEAKSLIEKAKNAIAAKTQKAVDKAKQGMMDLGK